MYVHLYALLLVYTRAYQGLLDIIDSVTRTKTAAPLARSRPHGIHSSDFPPLTIRTPDGFESSPTHFRTMRRPFPQSPQARRDARARAPKWLLLLDYDDLSHRTRRAHVSEELQPPT